ncbi:SAM-dependent methyltransferase, partial [Micromonospora globispora]
MDLDQLAALRTAEGSAALAMAAPLAGGDPLAAAVRLRSTGVPADLAAAALTQAELRRRAVGKFGPAAAGMFFT